MNPRRNSKRIEEESDEEEKRDYKIGESENGRVGTDADNVRAERWSKK